MFFFLTAGRATGYYQVLFSSRRYQLVRQLFYQIEIKFEINHFVMSKMFPFSLQDRKKGQNIFRELRLYFGKISPKRRK